MAQVLATDSVVNNALLPDTLERPAYVLVVQMELCDGVTLANWRGSDQAS